ncbi:hypothetical protein [Caballeronia sp. BR00000012568055]|uniref:hypothetical protein n=1 Tax=Caballeronia sp. BR00000012568055 TaxID=2918761 RepID=UPI0023F967B9|nr:hypothetical protein [Caballeronia sp. BR00000012568055]
MLKAKFFTNDVLGQLPPLARLLFAGLWTIADRAGRLEDRPARIHAEILPYDAEADVEGLLDLLEGTGFIARYAVDGARYVEITNWTKHQRPHPHEPESVIPPCAPAAKPRTRARRDIAVPRHANGATCTDIGDTCTPGSSGSSGSSRHSRSKVSPALPVEPREKRDSRGARLPEAWTLPEAWAAWAMRECEFSPPQVREAAARFADYWHAKAGADAAKRDWAATWRNWCRSERDRSRNAHGPPRATAARDGAGLWTLDHAALNALARDLGIGEARVGESARAFIARIQAAQHGRDRLH